LGKDYLVGVKTSLEKVFKDVEQLKGRLGRKAILKAARNEYESFQIILVSKERDLNNVRIEPTQLTCYDQGEVIQKENISFYQVGYVETKKPAYDVEFVGSWPDPLLPLKKFDVETGTVQPVWVTIYIPQDTSPGCYQGSIRIISENALVEVVEVSLTVWDFTLPEESSLQAVFSLYENCIRDYYKFDVVPQEILHRYYSFLLAHRINPTCLYLHGQPQPKLEDMEFCVGQGMNAVNIAYLYDWEHSSGDKGYFSDEFKRNLKTSLSPTVVFLRDHQWLDMAFVYGIDEPGRKHYNAVKEMFGLVERIAPGVRRALSEAPAEELFGYVDVWVPRIDDYDEEKCRSRQEREEEIWWYVCAAPHHPYPNFFIDYPAIDHRILFWLAWKYDISGFLYYSLNRWVTNYPKGQKSWPEVPWNTYTWGTHNGDGQLIYPGPQGDPYSSVRFEVIRDGIEDFEYLNMLRVLIKKLDDSELENSTQFLYQAEALISSLEEKTISSLTRYTKNPDQLLMYRELVADEIVRINEILNRGSGS
jgi:hypothetical protein